jgi:hypothetical protein
VLGAEFARTNPSRIDSPGSCEFSGETARTKPRLYRLYRLSGPLLYENSRLGSGDGVPYSRFCKVTNPFGDQSRTNPGLPEIVEKLRVFSNIHRGRRITVNSGGLNDSGGPQDRVHCDGPKLSPGRSGSSGHREFVQRGVEPWVRQWLVTRDLS